jgi:hypothetical protein
MCAIVRHPGRLARALLLVSTLTLVGCSRPAGRRRAHPTTAAVKLPRDTAFSGQRPVSVVALPLRIAPTLEQPTVSLSEPASVSRLRRKLQRAVSLQSQILIHRDRLVWALPDAAVPGGAAEPLFLLIKRGASVALLVNPKKKQYHAAPPPGWPPCSKAPWSPRAASTEWRSSLASRSPLPARRCRPSW